MTSCSALSHEVIHIKFLCTRAMAAPQSCPMTTDAAPVYATGSISAVIRTAPSLFVFCLVQIGLHLGIILGAGRLLGFSRRDILLASNANVGGERQRTLPQALSFHSVL